MSIQEKINQAKGAVKEGVGKVTGDIRMEREGVTEKVAAKVKDVAKDVKEGVGKVTGDIRMEQEGVTEKVAAKVKDVAKDVKDAVEGTIDGVKNSINKEKE